VRSSESHQKLSNYDQPQPLINFALSFRSVTLIIFPDYPLWITFELFSNGQRRKIVHQIKKIDRETGRLYKLSKPLTKISKCGPQLLFAALTDTGILGTQTSKAS